MYTTLRIVTSIYHTELIHTGSYILGYPLFTTSTSLFVIQMDAIYSAMGLETVLEQDNKVIAYVS